MVEEEESPAIHFRDYCLLVEYCANKTSFSLNSNQSAPKALFAIIRQPNINPAKFTMAGKQVLKRIRQNLYFESLIEVLRVFCRETNLHGMKHIFGTHSEYSRWQ